MINSAVKKDRWEKLPVTDMKTLKKQYDARPIEELEDMATNSAQAWFESRVIFINLMFYFDKTKRFRENKQFKASTFEEYLRMNHGLSPQQYHQERIAYVNYPEETKAYGVGFVNKVRNKCGALDFPKVFKEIKKTEQSMGILEQQAINNIIEKHATKRQSTVTSLPAWILQKEIAIKEQIILDLNKRLKEISDQNKKLIKTIKKLKSNARMVTDNLEK